MGMFKQNHPVRMPTNSPRPAPLRRVDERDNPLLEAMENYNTMKATLEERDRMIFELQQQLREAGSEIDAKNAEIEMLRHSVNTTTAGFDRAQRYATDLQTRMRTAREIIDQGLVDAETFAFQPPSKGTRVLQAIEDDGAAELVAGMSTRPGHGELTRLDPNRWNNEDDPHSLHRSLDQ